MSTAEYAREATRYGLSDHEAVWAFEMAYTLCLLKGYSPERAEEWAMATARLYGARRLMPRHATPLADAGRRPLSLPASHAQDILNA